MLATKECANVSSAILSGGAWLEAAKTNLLDATDEAIAHSPVASRVQRPILWRTAPFMCRSFAGGEEASSLLVAASALGVRLACRFGLTLVDWRSLSCRAFNQSAHMLADGTHWQPAAYGAMASELERRANEAAARGSDAAGASTPMLRAPIGTGASSACLTHAPQDRCECSHCARYVAFSWKLGSLHKGVECSGRERVARDKRMIK